MSVRAGDLLPERVVEWVDPEKMKILAALLQDPNMIHLDPAASAGAGLGHRLVNQGPINLGYVHTLLAEWAGGVDRVRSSTFRLLGNVYAGERVVAGGRVLAVGAGRLVECEVWLEAERAEGRVRVVTGTATVVAERGAP